jgi:hypothetical protein
LPQSRFIVRWEAVGVKATPCRWRRRLRRISRLENDLTGDACGGPLLWFAVAGG